MDMHGDPLTDHTLEAAIPRPKTRGVASTLVVGR
jgi:hypothetical protein